MSRISGLRRAFRLPWRGAAQTAREVDDELAFHLDMRAAELVAGGMAPDEARREARRQFGDLEFTRRYCRDLDVRRERATRRTEYAGEIGQDVRYAARQLRRSPAFALVAVLTLALGIGATTAIFSVVHGVLLRPLPYRAPERLVRIFSFSDHGRGSVSPLDFADWRDQARSFEGIAAISDVTLTLTARGAEPERLDGASVSANLFSVLGVRPTVGRAFAPGEDAPGAARVAVLSEELWRRRFGADPAVPGRTVLLDGESYTVVGVLPRGTGYPADADVWTPIDLSREAQSRGARYLRVVGRLAPAVSLQQADADLAAVAKRLEQQDPSHNAGYGVSLVGLHESIVGDVRTPLLVLLGAVGLVLLVACVNVANLLLVRAVEREGEIAVRTALGAGRGRILRQLVTEGVLVSLLGGSLGAVLAAWGTRLFVAAAPEGIPRLREVGVDITALALTTAVVALTGVVFGLVPAVHAAAPDLGRTLRVGGRGLTTRAGGHRVRGALVTSEMALAVMLLVGAGLLLRSFARLRDVNPGFRPAGVLTLTVTLPPGTYAKDAHLQAFTAALVARLAAIPGVRSAAAVTSLPLTGTHFGLSFTVDGRPAPDPADEPSAQIRTATPDYFATMGIPLRRGRQFTPRDRDGAPQVVVVNEELVRRYFPGEDPIGKRVQLGWTRDSVRMGGEIVGVVGDIKQFDLAGAPVPEIYTPYDQFPLEYVAAVVRTTADPALIAGPARAQVRALDPDLPVYRLMPMERVVAESVAQPRFYALLLGSFAGVALALAAIGIYGVVAYAVGRRTREMGLRMALGARPADVLALVVRQGLRAAIVGLAVGLVAAAAASRLLRSLLYELTPMDPATFAAAALALTAVAALACYVPARRAARTDPMVAMRSE